MKKSDLEQIIKEEITTVITENFLTAVATRLAKAGIKLFNKIRGIKPAMTPVQQKEIREALTNAMHKSKATSADYTKLANQIDDIIREMAKDSKITSDEIFGKLVGKFTNNRFPDFMRKLGYGPKTFSMTDIELKAIRDFTRTAARLLAKKPDIIPFIPPVAGAGLGVKLGLDSPAPDLSIPPPVEL